ncbi:MAG: hypothetical protein ACREXI_12105 [Caldimonas sp.]
MGQTADELKSALKLAAKAASGKPHFFAMIIKGGVEGMLIVDKRKIASKLIDAAKKEFNTSTVVKGVCFGEDDSLVFETAKPVGNLTAAAKRMAQVHAGLSIKPEFKVGRDDEHVDDDATPPTAPPARDAPVQKSSASQGAVPPTSGNGAAKVGEAPALDAVAKKAYDGLLAQLQGEVRAARDAKSAALPKIATLLEFAAAKADAGDHRTAVQGLQKLRALLDEPAAPPTAPPSKTRPAASSVPPSPPPLVPAKSTEPATDPKAGAFNTRFAEVAAKIRQAAEGKLPGAAAAKAKAVEAGALAQKKDFDGAVALLEEADKLLRAKPSSTARSRAPIEPDAARDFLSKVDADEDEDNVRSATAELLHDMKTALASARRMVTVDSVDALAAAMAAENGISKVAAREMIDNNQGRGFTGKSGTVYVLGNTPQAAHDEVHETVHLMSAPGGATQIMAKYGEQLNEALTEFFTKQMCAKLNVPDAVAYPEHVAFMNKLAPVVGYGMLYSAYMKNGGFDPVINKLTDIWIGKSDALPTPQKPPNTKGVISRDKVFEAMDKKFLNNFPPAGPALKFWNTVFFG